MTTRPHGASCLACTHWKPRRQDIGDCLIKTSGPYREVYLRRKAYERDRAEAAGLAIVPAAKIPKGERDNYRSEGHVHDRARRYMEKKLLRNLWNAWRHAA